VRDWKLPSDAGQDIWESFFRAQYREAPPRLIALLPPVPLGQTPPKRPIKPDLFFYDPLLDPADAVDQYLTNLRRPLIECAKVQRASAFKQARRRLLPSPLWHRSHTIAMARRLYRRAHLGWPYAKIAEAEGPRSTPERVHAVQMSVREWARILGMIDLRPLRSTAGRPKTT
jgi:hypothetical protein